MISNWNTSKTLSWMFALACALLQAPAHARAEPPTAEAVLAAMDKNLTFEARKTHSVMTVEGRRSRTYEMISYGRGEEDAAVEYIAPARDKGTRMLKLGDELWIYMPNVDRVQKISGHMMRQGMMGSDVSYEDMMASREMRKQYTAKVTGETTVDGHACWTLEMIAKNDTVTYPKRIISVDKQTYIPLKQELYALSGMLLKTWTMSDVKSFGDGRNFPTRMSIEDHVKKQSVTKMEFKSIEFGADMPREVFSQRWLERR